MPQENLNPLQRAKAKKYYERAQIAKQVRVARNIDRSFDPAKNWNVNRNWREYYYGMGGTNNFFDYLKTLQSNSVLDIGSGTGRAAKGISQMPSAKGLDFHITALSYNSDLGQNFAKEKIHITPVETLRSIKPNSIAGVIAVYSISYAEYPAMAIDKIDEVLVLGGALKAIFPSPIEQRGNEFPVTLKGPEFFVKRLNSLGYDVEVEDIMFTTPELDQNNCILHTAVVLAIKPGNPNAPKATDLMSKDLEVISREKIGKVRFTGYPDISVFNVEITKRRGLEP